MSLPEDASARRSADRAGVGCTDRRNDQNRRTRSTARRPADDGTRAPVSTPSGLKVVPNVDLDGVTVEISASTRGASTVAVADTEGATLAAEPFPGPGGTVRLEQPLTVGIGYYLLVDGTAYDQGYYSGPTYPYTAPTLHVTDGVLTSASGGPVEIPTRAYAIRGVTGTRRRQSAERR